MQGIAGNKKGEFWVEAQFLLLKLLLKDTKNEARFLLLRFLIARDPLYSEPPRRQRRRLRPRVLPPCEPALTLACAMGIGNVPGGVPLPRRVA
jgi:hypothetical protein